MFMTEKEEQAYILGQQAMSNTLLSFLQRYLSVADRVDAGDIQQLTECRLKVKEIFDYMDEPWPDDYDDLHLADVLDKLLDHVALLVDSAGIS